MKFILTDTHWILEDLDPMEWTFLDRIPEMAAGEDLPLDTRRRIFPDPIDVPASEREQHEGFIQDWNEYVRPDLESSFLSDRDQVSRDLAMATVEAVTPMADDGEGESDDEGSQFVARDSGMPARVEVARTSSDAWYSALNQARLLMNETYDLADATERFRWPDANSDEPFDGAKILLLAQYEFYTALQSIILEVMSRPIDPEDVAEEE